MTGPKNPEVGRVGWMENTVWLDAGKTNAREGHIATEPGTFGFEWRTRRSLGASTSADTKFVTNGSRIERAAYLSE